MKTILTFGVFDILHIGHVKLFKRSKEILSLANEDCRLLVAVQDSDAVLKYKPQANLLNTTDERVFMVSSVKYVDAVVVYRDVDVDIQRMDFDILVKGPDQNHPGFQRAIEWCRSMGKEVIELPRTEGISSTIERESLACK